MPNNSDSLPPHPNQLKERKTLREEATHTLVSLTICVCLGFVGLGTAELIFGILKSLGIVS